MKLKKPPKGSLVLLRYGDSPEPSALRRASDGRFYEPHDPDWTGQPLVDPFVWRQVKYLIEDAIYYEIWEPGEAL